MMTKLLLGIVGLAALSIAAPASAADLAASPYTKAPLPMTAEIYDWRGFYIGADGGYGRSHSCWSLPLITGFVPDGCNDLSGGLVGGQVGYRWEGSSWVFGLEAQGDWTNLRSSHVSVFNPTFTDSSKVQSVGLFTAQIGYAWNSVALLYVKGGLALTNTSYDITTTLGGVGLGSASGIRWGEALGIGFEYGFAPHWSAGIEYDHLFMGNANNSFSVGAVGASALNRISQDLDLVTVRVNYRFGGPFY
jgi:outer membrane immunogenic protein